MSLRRGSAPTLVVGTAAIAIAIAALTLAGQALAAETADAAYVRVDQVGYVASAHKRAFLFVVGAGSTFPHCMQHQVANLSGSLDGSPPIVRGAAVNGPNDVSQFDDDATSTPDGARACPPDGADTFGRFTGSNGARYLDNVGAWMSVEPAIDFTAGVPLALARVIADDR